MKAHIFLWSCLLLFANFSFSAEDFFAGIAEEIVTEVVLEKGLTIEHDYFTVKSEDVDEQIYAEIAAALLGQDLFNQDKLFADAYGTDLVDEKVSKALDFNGKGKIAEGLVILRELVEATKFQDIKAQYFLAKQYIIGFEKNIFTQEALVDQAGNCSFHLRGIEDKLLNDSNLSFMQKDYYAKGLADLMQRFDALGLDRLLPAEAKPSGAITVADTKVVASPSTSSPSVSSPSTSSPSVSSPSTSKPVASGNLAAVDNPIAKLNINSPSEIDQQTAETILKGLDIMKGDRSFTDSLKIINWSNTYSKGSGTFDDKMKQQIFKHYQSYRAAVSKYSHLPNISEKDTPQLYEQWITSAAQNLTAVPQADRVKLMKSLMTQESGRTQWKNFKPIISYAGAIGTGQFMYATAESIQINPYDPEENIKGIAVYLNKLISSSGLRKGLARYNGGNNPPSSSYQYADAITSRMSNIA